MPVKVEKDKYKRTAEQIKEHYELEKQLALKLRNASKDERKHLYTAVYDELYDGRVPHLPQLWRKANPEAIAWVVNQRMELLKRFLKPDLTFLEVGPGDCTTSFEVAKYVKKVYAVDVSKEITKSVECPSNFELMIGDGCSVPVAENSIDITYSHQLMEHLHPDDAIEQLQNIYKALAPNGIYICITPNRLSGPHDVSRFFDDIATGFHLKEYTVTELYKLFRKAGFSKVSWVKNKKDLYLEFPLMLGSVLPLKGLELILSYLPASMRRNIANTPMLFRGMTIIGKKGD
jgi:SAM-dependent methyltransferase